ncbi:MAG: hypothetical protein LBM27_00470 [Lactobacillaceae bacterium]|jgi:hypothetical protein|nr:hypothetical protein [Lactobacillaceae bacterium]
MKVEKLILSRQSLKEELDRQRNQRFPFTNIVVFVAIIAGFDGFHNGHATSNQAIIWMAFVYLFLTFIYVQDGIKDEKTVMWRVFPWFPFYAVIALHGYIYDWLNGYLSNGLLSFFLIVTTTVILTLSLGLLSKWALIRK